MHSQNYKTTSYMLNLREQFSAKGHVRNKLILVLIVKEITRKKISWLFLQDQQNFITHIDNGYGCVGREDLGESDINEE